MDSKTLYRVLFVLLALLAAAVAIFAMTAAGAPGVSRADDAEAAVPDIYDARYVEPPAAEGPVEVVQPGAEETPGWEPIPDDFSWVEYVCEEAAYEDPWDGGAYTDMYVEMYERDFGPVPEEGYYGDGSGVLTMEGGVNYYNGRRETWYSQRVLPGGGLDIPGRHVAEDGTIRDEDGLICVAASDLEYGTLVETSLGLGKVYDCGCPEGTTDIYVDW